MFKPLAYESLLDLIKDYLAAYSAHGHKVVKIKFSTPIPHSPLLLETINWKALTIFPVSDRIDQWSVLLDDYSKILCTRAITTLPKPVLKKISKLQTNHCTSALTSRVNTTSRTKKRDVPKS
uniref:Reverse transcriptase n=1 Tax=Mesocestoides corti TaxID=53468 RepID=A0A5K3ERN7_MESCO